MDAARSPSDGEPVARSAMWRLPDIPEDLARLDGQVEVRGGPLRIRAITPEDGDALGHFHGRLSGLTVYRRYLGPHPQLSPAEIERFTHVDYVDRLALVAVDGDDIVAVGRYDRMSGTAEAEVAFVVADGYQRRGIGTVLLDLLALAAWSKGIGTFTASTLAENRGMLEVFFASGFPVETSRDFGVVDVRFSIEQRAEFLEAIARRHGREAPSPEHET